MIFEKKRVRHHHEQDHNSDHFHESNHSHGDSIESKDEKTLKRCCWYDKENKKFNREKTKVIDFELHYYLLF